MRAAISVPPAGSGGLESEDVRTQRRRLGAVWLAAGSALAAMVAVSWYFVVRHGSVAPGGDMIGHAAAAEWLRTLPWWDWRGWSDWFFGGQAIGVNYPPLPHAWLRFTHPFHGQMAAVAVGLLALLPWGVLRLARAVGYAPRAQRVAVGAVLVLAAVSVNMHWILVSFHQTRGFFGSWPAMVAMVAGLFCAAWSASCRRPVACGIVAGLAVLVNTTVVPGVAVVCAALLATSGASFRTAVRWATTAGFAAVAVCAWWLVPFLAGWERLVRWDIPLSRAWTLGGVWQVAVLAALGVAATWAARGGSGPSPRLALAAGAGLLATLLGDLFGWLRPERWLGLPVLVAAAAIAGLFDAPGRRDPPRPARLAGAAFGVALSAVFVTATRHWEVIPLAMWLLFWPRRTWAVAGALAWAGVLLWVPLWDQIHRPLPSEPPLAAPAEVAAAYAGPGAEGLVYVDHLYNTSAGDVAECAAGDPWSATTRTGGRVRPLTGLYRETSPSAEFLDAEIYLLSGLFTGSDALRPHWPEAWQEAGAPSLDSTAAAEALGARWYAACDADGNVSVNDLTGTTASSVTIAPYDHEEAWHRAAVEWWMLVAADAPTRPVAPAQAELMGGPSVGTAADALQVPVLSSGESAPYPPDRAAEGVTLHIAGDDITVSADAAGWAWLRVPWDPDWRSVDATPVRKGGPGHLVVWVNRGRNELRWSVPGAVDVAATVTTGAAVLAVALLAVVNHRRGFGTDPDRRRPAAEAVDVFADTVDGWVHAAIRRANGLTARMLRRRRL